MKAAVISDTTALAWLDSARRAHKSRSWGTAAVQFKETDPSLTRALRALKKAGRDVVRAEIGRDGRIVLVFKNSEEALVEGNEWEKLKYVNAFANRNRRNPRLRYCFRRRGSNAIPLPGLPGSEEFMAAYAAALASLPEHSVEIGVGRTLPGTINALVVNYYSSGEWQNSHLTRRRSADASLNASARSMATSVSRYCSASTS